MSGGGGGGATLPILASGDDAMNAINTGIALTGSPMPTGDRAMDAINTAVTMAGTPINPSAGGGLFGSGGFLGLGASNQDVSKALSALGAGEKSAGAKTPTGPGSQSMNMAQSQAVRGGGAAGLDALVRALNARRDALLPQPVGISASAQARPTQGLLGF